jgi:glycosyltransferase involved in cell wall biosynthesis
MIRGISPINVLMTSTSYPADTDDWRGVFIRHLAGAIGAHDGVSLRLWAPPGELPNNVSYAASPDEAAWLRKLMEAGGISHLMRQSGWRAPVKPLHLLRMLYRCYRRESATDLYHVNWLQCALPLPTDGKPAVISVLGNDLNLLRLPLMQSMLRRVMSGRRVALCPNAEWMAPVLERAFGDIATIVPVSFGIDDRWYAIERAPATPPEWIAVTRLTANKLGPLFAWSEAIFRGKTRQLHLFGPMQETIDVPDWIHYHGAATPDALATRWFPRAQGLITLSTHSEGRPQTMLEAMASGLPIIASDMPAHESIVEHGVTGMLCDNPSGYADAVEHLEHPAMHASASGKAREWARTHFGTWNNAASRYANVYLGLRG